jgi:hypothetical protein
VRFVPSASLSSLGAFAAAYTVPIKEFISILPLLLFSYSSLSVSTFVHLAHASVVDCVSPFVCA